MRAQARSGPPRCAWQLRVQIAAAARHHSAMRCGAVGARLALGSGQRLGSQAGDAAPWPWSRCPAPRPGSQSPRSASRCARSPSVPRPRCTGRPPRARSAARTGAQAGSIRAPHTSQPSACAAAAGARPQTAATDCTALASARPVARPQVAASRSPRQSCTRAVDRACAATRRRAPRSRADGAAPRARPWSSAACWPGCRGVKLGGCAGELG